MKILDLAKRWRKAYVMFFIKTNKKFNLGLLNTEQ